MKAFFFFFTSIGQPGWIKIKDNLTRTPLSFHRENGADSILDLGLLEAPEKAQVSFSSLSLVPACLSSVVQEHKSLDMPVRKLYEE